MSGLASTPASNWGSQNKIQPSNYTHTDSIQQFKNAMLDAGVPPPDIIIGDGVLHRFKVDVKLIGWYSLHLNGKAAVVGNTQATLTTFCKCHSNPIPNRVKASVDRLASWLFFLGVLHD